MHQFKKVVILGTGLIGGSLGMALKAKHLAKEVVGLSRHKKNVLLAKKVGAIDRAAFSLLEVRSADLVILAAPVNTIIDLGRKISRLLDEDCIVIDVGSTKSAVVKNLSGILPNFVGCHPLAGLEKNGVAFARKDIFNGSICILTPERRTKAAALTRIRSLWNMLGVKIVLISPEAHDQALAFTSHLPHAVAFSLNLSVPAKFLKFCAGGFKDTTRIAASNAELWAQIFLSNRAHLLKALISFEGNLAALKSAVKNKDQAALAKILVKSNKKDKYSR